MGAFDDAHFQGDAVAFHVAFDGHEVVEQITAVHVDVGHSVVVLTQTRVHERLIVDLARFHAENLTEHLGGVDGVAHPGDVADVVALTLVDGDIHVDAVVGVLHHAVGHDASVAVAQLVVFFQDTVEVIAIVGVYELLLPEEVADVAVFVGLLDDALDFAVGEHLVALDVDMVHAHAVALVDVDVHNHVAR